MFIDSSIYIKHLRTLYKYFPKEQVKVVLYEDLKADAVKECRKLFKWIGVNDSFSPETGKQYNTTKPRKSNRYSRVIRKVITPHSFARKIFNTVFPEHYNYKIGEALHKLNRSSDSYEKLNNEARAFLHEYYRPYNKELAELTGFDLSVWEK